MSAAVQLFATGGADGCGRPEELTDNSFVTSKLHALLDKSPSCAARGISVATPDGATSQIRSQEHEMAAQQPLDDVLRRVQGEYIEMPGLRLTPAQAQRLWGLDRNACDTLLGALVDAKFLFRTRDGAFMRSDQARAVRT